MKKIILFSFLFVGFQTIAQVGIGTTTPDASAKPAVPVQYTKSPSAGVAIVV